VVATYAGMGGIVAAAGLLAPNGLSWASFATLYGALITLGFLLVGWLLLAVPDLAMKTREAVATAYAQSTLSRVDLEAAAARLRRLFEVDRIYQQDDVSLSRVAELAGLSGHQLSELVNVHFQTSFSRFVRQYRVEAAKRMLVDEPRASVLSVGVAVGFSSQSTFYVAFKEVVGVVPGEYRRRQRGEDRGADPPAIPG
jgi:AraC-like DNA-binding protein